MAAPDPYLIESEDDAIDLRKIVMRFASKWPWFVISVTLAIIITFFYLRYTLSIYQASTSLLVEETRSYSDPTEALFGDAFVQSGAQIANQTSILRSYPLIHKTLDTLDLEVSYYVEQRVLTPEIYKRSPFKVIIHEGYEQRAGVVTPYDIPFRVRILDRQRFEMEAQGEIEARKYKINLGGTYRFGERVDVDGFVFSVDLKHGAMDKPLEPVTEKRYQFKINSLHRMSVLYKELIQIQPESKEASILSLTLNSVIPEKAKDILETLVKLYIHTSLKEKNAVADNTIRFIDKELSAIQDSLRLNESQLQEFKSSQRFSDLGAVGENLLQEFNKLEEQRAQQQIRSKYYTYLKEEVSEKGNFDYLVSPFAFGVEDPILNQLVTDLLGLQQQRNAMVSEGQTKNPVLRMTEEKIKEVQQAITTSVDNLIASNGLIQTDLNTRIAALDAQVRLLPQSERTLVDIQRLLTLSENLYIFLMEKRAEAAITRSSNTPDVKVVEPAMQLDQPIYPNRKLAYFIALVLGVVVPFLFIFLRDRFDDRITDKDQLMGLTSIPFLGMVPHLSDLNPIAVFSRPKSSVAEAFRILRSNINFFGGEENGSRVMLITSSIAEEGKTFCAVNMASVMAMSGKKTVILGLDLRKPKLHSNFDLPNDIGLSNYLASGNGVGLSDIVLATNIPNLDFIPSGPTPPNPAELLMSERIGNLINRLKEDYDFVILDTPPTGLVTDAFILKQHSDLNIYVTRQGHTRRQMVRNTDELYRQKRFQDICILLNDVRSSYGYNYGYGYGYGYGYYEETKVSFWTQTLQKLGLKK